MKKFDTEIVSGSVLRSVWKLAWPVILLNLTNGVHSFADHIMIGRFVESQDNAANAAVGVAWQVFLVMVVFVASIFHGMNVLVARYAGRQEREKMSEVVYHSFLAALFVLVFVAGPVGYFSAPWLLQFVSADEEVMRHALPYLRILFTSGAGIFLVFMFTGAFHASGEPKVPLMLGFLSTIMNVVISYFLITGYGPFPTLGVNGAAIGTVIAPFFSVAIAISLIMRGKVLIRPPKKYVFLPDWNILRVSLRIGIPSGIQGVLLNIGGVFLMVFVASLGAAAQAAYTICYGQLFAIITWASFGLRAASATVMGQNIGAGDPERGKRAVAVAAYLGTGWAILLGLVFYQFPEFLLGLFDASEGPVFYYGSSLLNYLSLSGIAVAVTLALTGGLQGAGATKIPMYIAFLTQIVILLGFCGFFYAIDALSAEIVWLSILISHTSRLFLTFLVFRTNAWIHTKVEISNLDDDADSSLPT